MPEADRPPLPDLLKTWKDEPSKAPKPMQAYLAKPVDAAKAEPAKGEERAKAPNLNAGAAGGTTTGATAGASGYTPEHINGLVAEGGTAGHLGIAWGWYLLSPNWTGIWPEESRPRDYGATRTSKFLILMTDGEFNTAHYNGVASKNYAYGNNDDRINQNATNGAPFDQAENLCDGMKEQDIVIYTVGFGLTEGSDADDFLQGCATDTDHAYRAQTGSELQQAFQEIATSITLLRLSR